MLKNTKKTLCAQNVQTVTFPNARFHVRKARSFTTKKTRFSLLFPKKTHFYIKIHATGLHQSKYFLRLQNEQFTSVLGHGF